MSPCEGEVKRCKKWHLFCSLPVSCTLHFPAFVIKEVKLLRKSFNLVNRFAQSYWAYECPNHLKKFTNNMLIKLTTRLSKCEKIAVKY